MSPSSPVALYHAIPQAPVASAPVVLPDPEDEDDIGLEESLVSLPPVEMDAKISWIHFILGCAVLLPWNVMITAMPYFLSQLQGTFYREIFSSYMSTSFTVSNFIFLAMATATSKQASQARRIRISTLCLAFLTLLLTLTTFFHLPPAFFFFYILLNGITQANAGGYLQTSVVVVAALFGPLAMQAVMSGQAAVAVIVSGVQVVSSAISVWGQKPSSLAEAPITDGEAESRSAFLFFFLSTGFLVLSVGAHSWLTTMPQYKIAVESQERYRKRADAREADNRDDFEERRGLVSRGHIESSRASNRVQIMRVAKANILAEIAVAYTFIATLAVFPAITVSILPTNPSTHPLLFSAVHFFVFNVGDFVGRYACSFPRLLIWSSRKLLILSLSRTIFIPLFLWCNVQRSSTSVVPPIINSDFLFMLILLACGLSCGYISTMCMITSSSLEHNPNLKGRREDVDVAATVASFFLVGGLAVGSACSFFVRYWICDCNPFRS